MLFRPLTPLTMIYVVYIPIYIYICIYIYIYIYIQLTDNFPHGLDR